MLVEDLVNIGSRVARRLNETGIHTHAELRRVGAVEAYFKICERYPRERIPRCYVYALYGAIHGKVWHQLPTPVMKELKQEIRNHESSPE